MPDRSNDVVCTDDTQLFTIHLPCRLAKRAEKYAKNNGYTVTGVVIEALDTFLRGQKVDWKGRKITLQILRAQFRAQSPIFHKKRESADDS